MTSGTPPLPRVPEGTPRGRRPPVDVVVPFAGTDAALRRVVAHVRTLRLGDGDTVTVVDNRPEGAGTPSDDPIVLRAPETQSSYFARNRGAERGTAPWLLFADADVVLPPDWVDRYFEDPVGERVGVLAGRIVTTVEQDGTVARYGLARGHLGNEHVSKPGFAFAQTANAAVRRSAFQAVGGFREHIRSGGDADLSFRLQAAGWSLEPREAARVEHPSRATLRSMVRQYVRYGSGAQWLRERHPGYSPPQRFRSIAHWLAAASARAPWLVARGQRDEAAGRLLDSLVVLAHELGRLVPNEVRPGRRQRLRHARAALRDRRASLGGTALPARAALALFCDRFPELSETFVSGEVRELHRQGVAVTVYSRAPLVPDPGWDEAIPLQRLDTSLDRSPARLLPLVRLVLRHPWCTARDLAARRRWGRTEPVNPLRRLAPAILRLERERPGHIHVHFAAEAALDALRAQRFTGIPFSITAHAYELFKRPANLEDKFGEAAFATVPCAYNRVQLERAGLPVERVHVRMLGTDAAAFERADPYPDDGVTLAVGRLIEKKGFQVLIDAAARRDLGPVRILGDGPWRERLQAQIDAHGLGERVVLHGPASRAEIRTWMGRASLLVVPSVVARDGDQDALPVVIWEALAMELPVVGTTVAGLPEVILEPWGRLVAPGDAEALADAIAGAARPSRGGAGGGRPGGPPLDARAPPPGSGGRPARRAHRPGVAAASTGPRSATARAASACCPATPVASAARTASASAKNRSRPATSRSAVMPSTSTTCSPRPMRRNSSVVLNS